ncbi:hypothetical protein B0H10DRAFT_2241153 [Mycena sp. CBHHK59/15]|nr:hypothetical protein B0H10DRAFT_2241153 [Mycena sp. CBHHK59/15]
MEQTVHDLERDEARGGVQIIRARRLVPIWFRQPLAGTDFRRFVLRDILVGSVFLSSTSACSRGVCFWTNKDCRDLHGKQLIGLPKFGLLKWRPRKHPKLRHEYTCALPFFITQSNYLSPLSIVLGLYLSCQSHNSQLSKAKLTGGQSFQRRTEYVQQQDLHLAIATVRESLIFSALLRQHKDKLAYVEEVLALLEMKSSVRKRLTIAVELVAKPEFLVFFDESTSGLDSQTAWSICQLMHKLANHGQAILSTIHLHQSSAILMHSSAPGGKTVYFGDIGDEYNNIYIAKRDSIYT